MGYREVTVLEIKEVLLQWLDGAKKKLVARRLKRSILRPRARQVRRGPSKRPTTAWRKSSRKCRAAHPDRMAQWPRAIAKAA